MASVASDRFRGGGGSGGRGTPGGGGGGGVTRGRGFYVVNVLSLYNGILQKNSAKL